MGINVIEGKNNQQIIEYKFPNFYVLDNEVGSKAEDFEVLQVIGGGGFSQVLKVRSKKNLGIFAMKQVNRTKITEEYEQKYYENEINILKGLKHKNICKCYNVFPDGDYQYFIMDYMGNGDLDNYYKAMKSLNININEEKLWDIYFQCMEGLKFIHDSGLIHRDIKPPNLFVDDQFQVKIGDFNVSVALDENSAKNFVSNQEEITNMMSNQTQVGTGGYKAPEISCGDYDQRVDIYSMGVTFFELAYFDRPRSNREKYYKLGKYSKELNNLLEKMMEKVKNKRMNTIQ